MAGRSNIITFALLAGFALGQRVTTRPVILHVAQGQYTEEARKARIEGKVIIKAVINETGIPEDLKITQTLDKGLDEKAVQASPQLRTTSVGPSYNPDYV